ncbi:MAG: hypothetical protein RLZZ127_1162 [Planctomycetota bacterium]|jgi:RND family efflux transporter MFP subunit
MPRLTLSVLILVLAACGGAPAAGGKPSLPPPAPTPVQPAVEVMARDEVVRTARLEAAAQVDIRPRVSGQVDRVLVADGEAVAAGQVLVEIDPRPYQAVRDRAAAQLAQAEVQLAQARREQERGERIRAADPRAIGDEDLERRTQAVALAEAQRAAAAAALVQAGLDLEWTRVAAPFAGRVDRIAVDPGALVQAGTPLTTLVQADPVEVVLALDEREAGRLAALAAGASVAVGVGAVGEDGFPRSATVVFIAPKADAASATVQVRARLPGGDPALRPGAAVRALVPQSPFRTAVAVPETAILAMQSLHMVMIVGDDSTAQMRPVVPGRRLAHGLREVTGPVAAGTRIIVSPTIPRIIPDQPVQPVESATAAEPAR